jgi:hypothetical protein
VIAPRLLAAAVCVAVTFPATAAAAPKVRFERIAGDRAPGTPARYDRVGILQIGRPSARNVLVLNPGTSASAAYFAPLARSIVARAPSWQVWAVERRENLLEDQSMLDRVKRGRASVDDAFDHYLGWIRDPSITRHVRLIPDSEVRFAKRWGMSVEIHDLRRVVLRAKRLGGRVVVGGHSLGGSITTAYATWDFHGMSGASGLSGLVFIDGASSPTPMSSGEARSRLAALRAGSPWLQFGGIPAPFAGLFNSTGALSVLLAPDEPSRGQSSGLLPATLAPPFPVTNAGQYGYALDAKTSPVALVAAQAHLGRFASSGDPRGWDDRGALTPLRRMATVFSGWGLHGLDGTAWYHPLRLTIDAGAVAAGNQNPAQRVLGVRAVHGHDLPHKLRMYAFGAALGGRRVLAATRALARQSGIPRSHVVLVDRHRTYAHNDPNTASPKRDVFLKRLIPFLRGVARG